MKTFMTVLNSDSVNRYGMRFAVSALESALEQSWNPGIPGFFGHDRHRPANWNVGVGVHLEPGMARLFGLIQQPENEKECDQISKLCHRSISLKISEHVEPHVDELLESTKSHLQGQHRWEFVECACIRNEGLARRLAADLFESVDKDGLVRLDLLNPIAPGVFRYGDLALFAHPFFRRSQSRRNTTNAPFLTRLQDLIKNNDVVPKIALDPDMVGLPETVTTPVELAYWWGPKFDERIDNIPTNVTRHEANDTQRILNGISRTELWWYKQDTSRVFECEELRDIPSLGISSETFGCRYVHSIVDAESNTVTHMDGAIRGYDETMMLSRMDQNIRAAGRQSEYSKLWRLDGSLSVPAWKELLSDYFRDNPLIGEYLGTEESIQEERLNLPVVEENPPAFVPWTLKRGQGIRATVSYHSRDLGERISDGVTSWSTLEIGDSVVRCVDANVLEVCKLIARKGHALKLPDDLKRISFKDNVVEFPPILHSGDDRISRVHRTIEAIEQLCSHWSQKIPGRIVIANLLVDYVDRRVLYSFAGNCLDMSDFLSHDLPMIPESTGLIGDWLVQARDRISTRTTDSRDMPPLFEMVRHSGAITYERQFLPWEDVEFDFHAPSPSYAVHSTNRSLKDQLDSGAISVAPALLINESKCSNCDLPYRRCPCVKSIDDGVAEILTQADIAGGFLTDDPTPLAIESFGKAALNEPD